MNKERLLNVAKALRESPNPDAFTMDRTQHKCGTPACAIGHYVARPDLQSEFAPLPVGHSIFTDSGAGHVLLITGEVIYFTSGKLLKHFDLDDSDYEELFGGDGCGDAKTSISAAEYIERFVAERS